MSECYLDLQPTDARGGAAVMPARNESSELILKMYKHAAAITALIDSGKLTREDLGRSMTTQCVKSPRL